MNASLQNIPASILSRLRNQSDELNRPFAEILQYYAIERFLYRLSKTKYANKFVLKGGLLFYVWSLPLRRATRDIDFRGYVSSSREALIKIMNEVIAQSAPEDGIVFDPDSIFVEETQIDADYQGIRVKITALLERTRIHLQIDIGFSDELASKAELIEYPNILSNFKHVQMKGYPKEAVVAEKFHAMVRHGDLNSRMKDYYDLWLLMETFEFDGASVQKAIETTFKQRDTELPLEKPSSLADEYVRASENRWSNFLRKMEMETGQIPHFEKVIENIWFFLEHPLRAASQKSTSSLKWIPQKGWR